MTAVPKLDGAYHTCLPPIPSPGTRTYIIELKGGNVTLHTVHEGQRFNKGTTTTFNFEFTATGSDRATVEEKRKYFELLQVWLYTEGKVRCAARSFLTPHLVTSYCAGDGAQRRRAAGGLGVDRRGRE